jgi:hypothetical protein
VGGDPVSFTDPEGEAGPIGVVIGVVVEIGVQAAANHYRGCDVYDPRNYDLWDVGISGLVGALSPGLIAVAQKGHDAWKATKTIKDFAKQIPNARTQNRINIIKRRMEPHKAKQNDFAEVVAIQAAWQGAKAIGKAVNGGGGSGGCQRW